MWKWTDSTVFDVGHSYWTLGYGRCQNNFVNIRCGRLHGQCTLMIAGQWMQHHAQQFRCRIAWVEWKINWNLKNLNKWGELFTNEFCHLSLSTERIRFISFIPGRNINTAGFSMLPRTIENSSVSMIPSRLIKFTAIEYSSSSIPGSSSRNWMFSWKNQVTIDWSVCCARAEYHFITDFGESVIKSSK